MDATAVRVLVVDDNPGDARLVEWALAHEPDGSYRCERAGRISEAIAAIERAPVDVVLLDLGLPDSSGMSGLRRLRERAPDAAVVVLTGSEDPVRVREALAEGAQEYLVKGVFPSGHLGRVVRGARRRQRLESEIRAGAAPDALAWNDADVGDAFALIVEGKALAVNDAWVRLAGTPRGGSDPDSERFLGGPRAGEVELHRDGSSPVRVDFVVRTWGAGPSARSLVRLRDRSPRPEPAVATSAGPPPRLLDATAWAQLEELAGSDPTFVPALIEAFLAESRPLIAELEAAAGAGDAARVEQIAHRLKSGCAQLAALELAQRLGALERSSRVDAPEAIRAAVTAIVGEFPAVAAELEMRRAPR